MHTLKKGILIAIEGIDGSGKSTLANALYRTLHDQQFPVILTKEPGGSTLGKHLREILQTQEIPLDPKAEYLLFAADRSQHFTDVIIPALHTNHIVISDRLADSSLVYQGYGRKLDRALISTVNSWAMQNITPDLILYVRIDAQTAHARLKKRMTALTAFEQDRALSTQTLIDGFDTIFKDRDNVILIDGQQQSEQITIQTIDAIRTWLYKHNLLTPP